ANIANLFLVRSEARQQEISIRRALGAGTGGVAGYFLAESLLLSLAGGAAGLSAAWYGVRLLVAFGPATLPRLNEVHLAPVHLVFALALTALAAIAFTAVPLARAGRSRIALQDGEPAESSHPSGAHGRTGRPGAHAARRVGPAAPKLHSPARAGSGLQPLLGADVSNRPSARRLPDS